MVLEVEFRSFSEISEKLCFKALIVTHLAKIMKIWESRFSTIKIPQQICRYFTVFSKLQIFCFRDPSSHF